VTKSASIEQDTSTAKASVFSVKVLMPSLQEELRVLNDNLSNVGHLVPVSVADEEELWNG
jgi:hypothetical protein